MRPVMTPEPGAATSPSAPAETLRRLCRDEWAWRQRCEEAEGGAFSLRRFHDDLLALGPMPLPTLEQEMALSS